VNSKQLSFGKITIDVEGYVPIDPVTLAQRCKLLQLADQSAVSNKTAGLGSLMVCTMAQKNNDPTTCGVTITCDASFDVRGAVSVALSIPGEFQTLAWQVKSTTWEFFEQHDFSVEKKWTRYETTVNNTLTSGSSASIMKGTMEKPTSVKFGLTRGFAVDLIDQATAGLQLSFSQLDVQKDLIVAIKNMPDAHILSFDFDVLPALHIEKTEHVLTLTQLAATIFSLIASATKLYSMMKRKTSLTLDTMLLKRDDVPEDVQRRTDYLNETNLLHRHFKKMMHHHGIKSKRPTMADPDDKDDNHHPRRPSALSALKKKRASSILLGNAANFFSNDTEGIELTVTAAQNNLEKPKSAVFVNPLREETKTKEKDSKDIKDGVKEEAIQEVHVDKDTSENVANVNNESEKTVIVVSEGEAKKEAASVTEAAPPVTATEKTNVELSQQVAALENQNFELLTRLEALETMIVPTDEEIQAAPSSSMLAASMKNVLSAMT